MDYTAFEKYPIQILGIDESYNDELTAIEEFIISDIAYTGEQSDIESILPYFVFHAFCVNRRSEVSAMTGEQSKVAEFTVPSSEAQTTAWNIGVKKLAAICLLNTKSVSYDYNFEYTLFGAV